MNDTTLPKNPRRRNNPPEGKVRPGFGLHDWMNLLRRTSDLAQRRGAPLRRDITMAEVRNHNKPYDGWMILRGKVYNISPYMAYHPGGSEVLEKVCGRDGTKLFDRYHQWVNLDGLIGPLLLGYLKVEKKKDESDESEDEDEEGGGDDKIVVPVTMPNATNNSSNRNDGSNNLEFAMPAPRPPKGMSVPSLLPSNNQNEEDEEDLMQL